ncbi:MAG TPA: hypothetical protein VHR42_09215 [Clostridia bacterium]|nr:hypothetical protein [Clostridia bacterium]
MLLKLIKYEFKSSAVRFMAAFGAFTVIFGILLAFFRDHVVLLAAVFGCGLVALSVITFLTLFHRYNTNLYGNEGYLMFTLPVSGKKILLAKLISALFWSLVLGIATVIYIALYVCVMSPKFNLFQEILKLDIKPGTLIVCIVGIFVGLIVNILEIYFAISFSKLPVWRKFAVPAGFLVYIGANYLVSLPLAILSHVNQTSEIVIRFNSLQLDRQDLFFSVNLYQLAFNILFSVVFFFATAFLLERKTCLK